MSATVKLSSKLPGDPETNGLDSRAADLIEDPDSFLVGIVWFDTAKVTYDTDSGDRIPTVRVRRVEPLGRVSDVPQSVMDAVALAEEERTGRKPLPFELVEVQTEAGDDQ